MKTITTTVAAVLMVILLGAPAFALTIDFARDPSNPATPKMGDRLHFQSVIRNNDQVSHEGLVAWLSLVQIDKGKEQPVDLEDWSAHKAVTSASLKPGQTLDTTWPLRLIQAGTYRVLICAMSRTGGALTTSPFIDFVVRPKPVVESSRVMPVAVGVPLLLAALVALRLRRSRSLL